MKVITKKDELGKVVYDSKIIWNIVDCALSEVKGVIKYPVQSKQWLESIKVDNLGDEIFINVFVKLHASVNVKETASDIQSTVKNALENTYGFKVHEVNVHVIDVEFDEN
ncbi:MAG: Asp23/Gls24 family envelope stress response protein [Corallococcus sp.]|nr:Asp23/Gls24 family envelope stress response protein [Corallococcus sp.]